MRPDFETAPVVRCGDTPPGGATDTAETLCGGGSRVQFPADTSMFRLFLSEICLIPVFEKCENGLRHGSSAEYLTSFSLRSIAPVYCTRFHHRTAAACTSIQNKFALSRVHPPCYHGRISGE